MRRTARGEEFRSNVHRGASVESVRLDARYDEVARKAARVLGLHVAGVDMLEGRDGPLVMEVNASPGLEGIEAATGIDVAMAVVRHAEECLAEPVESLRELTALDKGFVVAELALGPRNRLVGLTIAESKLDALDVRVLSVRRGSLAMPNPGSATRLFVGDALVLFGTRASLETMVARS
jgi:ribosomal protein S6--L-glutamate ligase